MTTVVDTDYMILLRAGQQLNVPIKYLIVKNPSKDQLLSHTIRDGPIEDVFTSITEYYDDPEHLVEIGVDIDDIIYVIASLGVNSKIVNQINSIETRNKTWDQQELLNFMRTKKAEIDRKIKEEGKKLEYYDSLTSQLLQSRVCPYTPLIITGKQKYYQYVLGSDVDVTEFFSRVKLSSEIVYVQYNNADLNLIKIDPQSNYEHVEVTTGDKHLYVIVLFNDKKILIDLDTVTLIAAAKLIDPIVECDLKVKEVLELIFGEEGILDTTAETNVSGESLLFLTNTDLDLINTDEIVPYNNTQIQVHDYLLKYLLTSHPEISEFIHFSERTKLLESKKKIPIYLRAPVTENTDQTRNNRPSVIANLVTDKLVTDLDLNLSNVAPHIGRFTRDTYFVQIKIDRADNEALAQLYLRILSYVFGQYVDRFDEYYAEMYETFSEFLNNMTEELDETLKRPHSLISSDKKDHIESFPGTVIGYGPNDLTPGQMKNRGKFLFETFPDIFPEGYSRETAQLESKPLIIPESKIDEWSDRQALHFPQENPLFHFVCPDEEYRYPGVRVNKLKSNRDNYPFLPRCFKKDQMHPGTNTYEYYKGKGKEIDKERRQVTATKIARYLQEAKIDPKVDELLGGNTLRMGVRKSPKSVLHCLLLATDNNYIRLNEQQQNDLVNVWASKMKEYAIVCRQEYFDMTESEIKLTLDSLDVVDTKTVFRALEELFDLNIYVIIGGYSDKNLNISFEVPRFKEYHLRVPNPNRDTILLYKHEVSDNNDLDWPQYEIVRFNRNYVNDKLNLIHDLFTQTIQFTTIESEPVKAVSVKDIVITKQHINPEGRVDYIIGEYEDREITIIGLLHPPFNVPETDTIIYSIGGSGPGDFVANAIDDSGMCIGKWYNYDNNLICIPYQPFEPEDLIKNKIAPQIILKSESYKLIKIQNDYETLHSLNLEILEWFVRVSAKYEPEIYVGDLIKVGATNYDTSLIQPDLGSVTSVKECFEYLRSYYNDLVDPQEDMIIVHSDTYKQGLIDIIRRMYQRLPQNPDQIIVPEYIKSYRSKLIRQFAQTNELIFETTSDLNKWNKTKSRYASKRRTESVTKLKIYMNNEVQPIVYFDGSDLFLIVNTFESDMSINQAYSIAKNWDLNKFVLTDLSEIETANDEEYNIYFIDVDGNLTYTDNDPTKPLSLLQYSDRQYAAILPL